MSSDRRYFIYKPRQWYMTRDYQNLFRYQRNGGLYEVVRYFDCAVVYEAQLNDVLHFMNKHCMNHNDYTFKKVARNED